MAKAQSKHNYIF